MKFLLVLYIAIYPGVFEKQDPPAGVFLSKQQCEEVKKTMIAPDRGGYFACIVAHGG